jgi:predicted ATPase
MHPSAITLRNFRSFGGAGGVRMELRPITLLYGRNNSGKSSLLRSLPLLADSIGQPTIDALNLDARFRSFDLDFDAVRWKGRSDTDDHTLGIGLEWHDSPLRLEWAINEHPEWRRLVVERFSAYRDGTNVFDATWKLRRHDHRDSDLVYEISRNGNTEEAVLPFKGLVPMPDPTTPELTTAQALLKSLGASVLWLRSQRAAVWRYTRWRGAVRWDMMPSGIDASVVLAGEPELRDEVSRWYAEHLGFDLVIEEVRKREVRTLLRNRNRVAFDVDLIDTGEGVTQVLPTLTALAMVRRHRERGRYSMLALEEPEDHLHPDLQRSLATRICEVAADTHPLIILETHSEHILLTVRLQILEGRLSPDDVVIYWVARDKNGESHMNRVFLDEQGRFIGDWPPDAFQDDIVLAADIQDAISRKTHP